MRSAEIAVRCRAVARLIAAPLPHFLLADAVLRALALLNRRRGAESGTQAAAKRSGRLEPGTAPPCREYENVYKHFIRYAQFNGSIGERTSCLKVRPAMLTEHISPRFIDLDSWSRTGEMTAAMHDGQLAACAAVKPALPAINAAVDDAAAALKRGGRLVYVGAGTSGRIAIQDGAELRPPTTGQASVCLRDGRRDASDGAERRRRRRRRSSGAEAMTQAESGRTTLWNRRGPRAGTTPFTVGALRCAGARARSASRLRTTGVRRCFELARHKILIETGTEVLAGSTRMQAGTAQRSCSTCFSTAVMVKLGGSIAA